MKIFIYILIGFLAIALICGIIIGFIFINRKLNKINAYLIWKKLYKLAKDYDYYLLNNVNLDYEGVSFHISHLLIADKNIYVISSRYYSGNLSSNNIYDNEISVTYPSTNQIELINNPIIYNENRCNFFIRKFIDSNNESLNDIVKSIVITNDSINYDFKNSDLNKNSYLCHKKEVYNLIIKIEKESKYAPLDVTRIQDIVDQIHQISTFRNKQEQKNK